MLRAIDLLFFSNSLQSFLFDGKFIYFQLYWSIKVLMFDIISGWLLLCSWFNATATAYWKHLSSLFLGFIVAFLFSNHLGEFVYDPPLFRLILWSLQYNESTLSKKIHFLSLILLTFFCIFVKKNQKGLCYHSYYT